MRSQPTNVPFSWSQSVVQPALVIINTLALISGPLFVVRRFDAERPWLVILLICLLFAVEGYTTTIWLLQPARRLLNHGYYRIAELLVLFVLLRLAAWGIAGNWPSAQWWTALLFNPLLLIEDAFFIVALVAAFLTWSRTLAISNIFIRLAPDTAEQQYYAILRSERSEGNQPMPANRVALQRSFAQQFLVGAIILLVCTAAMSIEMATIGAIRNPLIEGIGRLQLPSGLLAGLIGYFLTGFLLFSQARLAMMEARWLADDAVKSPGIERIWSQRTAWILLAVGLAAAFLPLGSTFLFSRLVSWLIWAVMWGVTAVFQILSFLFLMLFSFLMPNRTPPEVEPELLPSVPPFQPPLPQPTNPAQTDILAMILTSAFWAVAIVMGVLAFSYFLRERDVQLNSALPRQAWQAFLAWWRALWQGIKSQVDDIRQTLQTRRQSDAAPKTAHASRFVRLNALSPREKVRYFYLSTVKRAGREGVVRQESETPSEYAADLREKWPEASPDIDGLTEAFLQAQYGRQPVTETDIPPIKAQWQRVKASIRRRVGRWAVDGRP